MLELNPIDGFFFMLGVGAAFWGAIDMYTGHAWLWPTIFRPGISFKRDDDGGLFYLAALSKIGFGAYMIARVMGV